MRELVASLLTWLEVNRDDVRAYQVLAALARETLKRADSPDPSQREFDAEQLAQALDRSDGFAAAKRWILDAKVETYAEARRASLDQHFRSAGHTQTLCVRRRSPGGKHRAVWFLEPHELSPEVAEPKLEEAVELAEAKDSPLAVRYEFTAPGHIRPAWYVRPLIGSGSFVTWSWRGLLWLGVLLVPVLYLAASAFFMLGYQYARRPLETADLASMIVIGALGWGTWRGILRPLVWLVEDRVANAPSFWTAASEDPAQFELTATENYQRKLQLVRYTAVCPICAGQVELRYALGLNRRRLVGCCSESPQEHVFSFDRVLRAGKQLSSAAG